MALIAETSTTSHLGRIAFTVFGGDHDGAWLHEVGEGLVEQTVAVLDIVAPETGALRHAAFVGDDGAGRFRITELDEGSMNRWDAADLDYVGCDGTAWNARLEASTDGMTFRHRRADDPGEGYLDARMAFLDHEGTCQWVELPVVTAGEELPLLPGLSSGTPDVATSCSTVPTRAAIVPLIAALLGLRRRR